MAKIKYRFDPNTLTYQKIASSTRKKMFRAFSFLFVTVSTAFIFHIVFTSYFDTPKELKLKQEQEELVFKFEMLNNQLNQLGNKIANIQMRDDHLYRPIFELDAIPSSVREAGVGGVEQYRNLEKFTESDLLITTAKKLDKLKKKVYIQSKSFDSVIKLAKNKEIMINSIPAIQPIALKDFRRISDYYGSRRDPFNGRIRMHYGMDFTGPLGTEIYATGDGKVVKAEFNHYGYGKEVVIDHGFGYKTIYAHLRKILVEPGQKVKRGQVIGTLGNTGRSTGPHLHYEVRKNNRPVNPINYYFNDITAEQYEEMIATAAKSRKPMD
jgi:murein DD-endopeptidase MepM/ murein hydrolase activator NlpD